VKIRDRRRLGNDVLCPRRSSAADGSDGDRLDALGCPQRSEFVERTKYPLATLEGVCEQLMSRHDEPAAVGASVVQTHRDKVEGVDGDGMGVHG
jgi:hypothetical protein